MFAVVAVINVNQWETVFKDLAKECAGCLPVSVSEHIKLIIKDKDKVPVVIFRSIKLNG